MIPTDWRRNIRSSELPIPMRWTLNKSRNGIHSGKLNFVGFENKLEIYIFSDDPDYHGPELSEDEEGQYQIHLMYIILLFMFSKSIQIVQASVKKWRPCCLTMEPEVWTPGRTAPA